jgi:hypothetical protein
MAAMSTTDQTTDLELDGAGSERRITLELGLEEAEALRAWLLKPAADGSTSLDEPLVNGAVAQLGRAVDAVRAILNVRRALEHAGLEVAQLSDNEVRELGRRVSEAAQPGIRA